MNILHIGGDKNFIGHSKNIFEKYYPNQNTFLIHSPTRELSVIRNPEDMIVLNLSNQECYDKISNIFTEKNIDKVVLHGLNKHILPLIKFLKQKYTFKVYWLFWGYELYETIGYENNYPLIDSGFNPLKKKSYFTINKVSKIFRKLTHRYRPKYFKELFHYVDYFCFWNIFDYNLLQKFYPSKMKYKFFAYQAHFKNTENNTCLDFKNSPSKKIMINHQASLFGNHDTVFKKIRSIDSENLYVKIVPLSYGSKLIKESVVKLGNKLFGHNFKPISTLLSREDYFSLVGDVDVAIFGQNRQEASGNISQLLKRGVKIFLRNNNSLLQYYRSHNYIIYSFEDDLKNISDLEPLSMADKLHNYRTSENNKIYYDDFMPQLFLEED